MARKKSSRSLRKSNRRWPDFSSSTIKRGAVTALWLIGVVTVGSLWAFGGPRLEAYAETALARESIVVKFADPPLWFPEDLADELSFLAAQQMINSPFDREGLQSAEEALDLTGWFEAIHRVERTAPDRVIVTAQFRTPFGLIRDSWGAHLVDRDGHLLPRRYPTNAEPTLLPILVHPIANRPASAGDIWPGPDIQAGLSLSEILMDRPWFDQIAVIDLGEFAQTESIWLTTQNNARILWGRAPGQEVGAEVPHTQKLQYLDYFYEQYGTINRGLASIDITHDKVYAHD